MSEFVSEVSDSSFEKDVLGQKETESVTFTMNSKETGYGKLDPVSFHML